jgi:hypothetical protein
LDALVAQPACGVNAACARHPKIEQDDIGLERSRSFDRARGVVCFASYVNIASGR